MLIVGKVIAIALAALLANYLLNQLSTLRDFPGKTWLLVRLIGYLVVIAVAHEVIGVEGVSDRLQAICRYVGVAAGVAVLYEGFALWRHTRRRPAEVEDGLASAELLKRLHNHVRLQVKERLNYATGTKAFINVAWGEQQAAVGKNRTAKALLKQNRPLRFLLGGREKIDIGENILEAFNLDHVDRKLLILGEPGSGKTTTLLKLAEALIAQFETTNQVPYVFELSAWQDDRQPILDWLTEQLKLYHSDIDLKVSHQWIKHSKLLPFLDGLDELGIERQRKCVEKINDFAAFLGQQVVVCCRSNEYAEGQVKLDKLNGALCLQPLTPEQIERYLRRSLRRMDILQALKTQPELTALLDQPKNAQSDKDAETPFLRIPLFLQMLVVAYRPNRKIETKADLFDEYISSRLRSEPNQSQTKHFLKWLALRLNENNIPNNFLIEEMQPSWLVTVAAQKSYQRLVIAVNALIIFSAVTLVTSIGIGLAEGMTSGLFFTLVVSLIEGRKKETCIIEPVEILQMPSLDKTPELSNSVLEPFFRNPVTGAKIGAKIGVLLALINLLVIAITGSLTIRTITSSTAGSLLLGLVGGLSIGILRGFSVSLGNFIDSLKVRLETRKKPNQGIAISARNFLVASLYLLSLYLLSLYAISSSVLFPIDTDSLESLRILILFGLYLAFYKGGGLPVVQHAVLRLLLYYQGSIPWNYAQFLKYTTERRLTQQIGGRFRFIHRELLNHFAAMDTDASGAP